MNNVEGITLKYNSKPNKVAESCRKLPTCQVILSIFNWLAFVPLKFKWFSMILIWESLSQLSAEANFFQQKLI